MKRLVTPSLTLCKPLNETIGFTMTPAQSRMARAALQWSLHDLAAKAAVSRMTCARFELGKTVAAESIEAMRAALVEAGADFSRKAGRVGVTVPE